MEERKGAMTTAGGAIGMQNAKYFPCKAEEPSPGMLFPTTKIATTRTLQIIITAILCARDAH